MNIQRTPVQYVMTAGNTRIYVKREDLIPFSFGGNKVRIANEVFEEMKRRGNGAVISYGSTSSNLNRVIAHMAEREGKKCYIIVKKEEDATGVLTSNEKMIRGTGAVIVPCTADAVRETVHRVLETSRSAGENPYYLYGDETGHGGEEVLERAYRKVFPEILLDEAEAGVHFDTIYLPVGTGSTYNGLKEACDSCHAVTGISVARTHENEPGPAGPGTCRILDGYRMGGYGTYDKELTEFILRMLREHSLALDPTYTGKAFYGMFRELSKGTGEENVLFLHTGGTPLFFDFLNRMENRDEI